MKQLITTAAVAFLLVAALARPRATLADESVAATFPTLDTDIGAIAQALPTPSRAVEVLSALRTWTRQPEAALRSWANAIADVSPTRADAIWLASQASVESRFAPEVLSFECNDATWRATHVPGECDHGFAVGPWQQHDRTLIDAPPHVQASKALAWMRARPSAWTTWRAARAQADAWLGAR